MDKTMKDILDDPVMKAIDELMKDKDLKPCPFCESTNIRIFPTEMKTGMKWGEPMYDYTVMCCDCKVSTRKEIHRDIAKNLWNHRSKDNRLAIYQAVAEED
jgi:hypothetical protein